MPASPRRQACLTAGRENYIKNNLNDITCMSELSPFIARKQGGLIRTYNLASLSFAKLCAH